MVTRETIDSIRSGEADLKAKRKALIEECDADIVRNREEAAELRALRRELTGRKPRMRKAVAVAPPQTPTKRGRKSQSEART
jgi:hypothetical protein